MTQVSEVALFFSKFSNESKNCVQFINKHKIPVHLVALDTPLERKMAIEGSIVPIKNVPSMVVTFSDGNTQLYVGNDKILRWLSAAIQPQPSNTPHPQDNDRSEPRTREEVNRQKEVSALSKVKNTKKKNIESIEIMEDEPEEHIELIMASPESNLTKNKSGLSLNKDNTKKTEKSEVMKAAERMRKERENSVKPD